MNTCEIKLTPADLSTLISALYEKAMELEDDGPEGNPEVKVLCGAAKQLREQLKEKDQMMKPINDHMTAAFRLAHRASESDKFDLAARNAFRAIAHEIWEAHGRPDDNEWPAGTVPNQSEAR